LAHRVLSVLCFTGNIYAYSSRVFLVNGHAVPYAWNHSIVYDAERYHEMPYLVQQLTTRDIDASFDYNNSQLSYQLTATIDKGSHPVSSVAEIQGGPEHQRHAATASTVCSFKCLNRFARCFGRLQRVDTLCGNSCDSLA